LHIYVFGSLCRGEIDTGSDVDLLAIVNEFDKRLSGDTFSIYSYERIKKLWQEGNPFSWHLYAEAKMIYSTNYKDFIVGLGKPNKYDQCLVDCNKFFYLYCDALDAIKSGSNSQIFEMSTIFLSLRNFATCFLLGTEGNGNFSRRVALQLGNKSVKLSREAFTILEQARILSIRGKGEMITRKSIDNYMDEIMSIQIWMEELLNEVTNDS